MIAESTINEIQDYSLTTAIGKLYTDESYKVSGEKASAKSPFTNERTGSFHVNNIKQIWKCFSTNISGKSVIDFAMKYKNIDFVEAVKVCAEALNIPIEYVQETNEEKEKREQKQDAVKLLSNVASWYKKCFETLGDNWAKKYMFDRQFTQETLSDFEIGYEPSGQMLYYELKEQGAVTSATELGLLKEYNGTYSSIFNGRVIFPIHDSKGKCVAFGARVNPQYASKCKSEGKKEPPKYINSAESKLFSKSDILYGFHLAKKTIEAKDEAYLVEGYTDVMRLHQIGITNTIAPLGTALSDSQVKLLKKYCNKVILLRDFDGAGQKAAFRDMEILLRAGMFVSIVFDSDDIKSDPDDIGRRPDAIQYISNHTTDAILFRLDKCADSNMFERKLRKTILPDVWDRFTSEVIKILKMIPNESVRNNYLEVIAERYGVNKKNIQDNLTIKEVKQKRSFLDITEEYIFPREIDDPNLYADDVREYGLFQHDNKIYILDTKGEYLQEKSNFSIEIIQHMQDEKFPMKLIRLCNIYNREIIFDTLSHNLNTLQSFEKLTSDMGNFFYNASANQHKKLLRFLFDKMGHGRKIDTLGWQPEGFWVWNNKIIIPSGQEVPISEEGIFKHKEETYYIPSANQVYAKNQHRFSSQKKFISVDTTITLEEYMRMMVQVHRKHAYSGVLFSIASVFQDIVVSHLGFFPLMFLYGKGSSGKDNLGEAIQSFFGKPQSAINLESGLSTGKANIREFAQFSNGISQLSEYKRNEKQVDGMLKSMWDRRGYKIGTIESKVSTDEVPIISSAVITGNEYPESQPLLMRMIFEEMNKNEFTEEEMREFDKFKSIVKQGVSSITNSLIHVRPIVEKQFVVIYKEMKTRLNVMPEFANTPGRIIENISVLTAFYKIFEEQGVRFPFGYTDLLNHWSDVISNIKNKLTSASPMSKFWDCFLFCMRGGANDNNPIIRNKINVRKEGGCLQFNFTTIFGIVQRQWYSQYHELAPAKSEMRRMLKEDLAYIEDKKAIRINPNATPTSALCFDMSKLSLYEEITSELDFQRYRFEYNTPQLEDSEDDLPY